MFQEYTVAPHIDKQLHQKFHVRSVKMSCVLYTFRDRYLHRKDVVHSINVCCFVYLKFKIKKNSSSALFLQKTKLNI